jgi:hypothetical protein
VALSVLLLLLLLLLLPLLFASISSWYPHSVIISSSLAVVFLIRFTLWVVTLAVTAVDGRFTFLVVEETFLVVEETFLVVVAMVIGCCDDFLLLLIMLLLAFWTTDVAHFDISVCDGVLGVTVANGCFLLLLSEVAVAVALVVLANLLSGVIIVIVSNLL